MAGTVTDLGSTLLVEGDWGTDDFLRRGGTETLIDCTTATWGFNTASGDDYPCRLKDWQNAFTFKGGTVNGTISLTASWGSKYSVGQGAAVFAQNPAGPPTITGWRMDRVWDAIRVTFRDGYIIENCHVSRARDDASSATRA